MQSLISWFERHNKLSWIITILIAIIIFYVSSLIFPSSTGKGFNWKPIAYHFYAFLIFSAFIIIAITKGKNKKLIPLTIILAIIYAISDEVHQLFVPGRAFAFADILTDSAGILFAVLIYVLLRYSNFKGRYIKETLVS